MTKRRSGFGPRLEDEKGNAPGRAAECWPTTSFPCQSRSHGLSLSKPSPVAAEAVRTFASIVEKGEGVRGQPSSRKGPNEMGVRRVRGREAGRRAVPDGDLQVRRDERSGPVRAPRTQKTHAVRSSGRARSRSRRSSMTWAWDISRIQPFTALFWSWTTPREAARLFEELGLRRRATRLTTGSLRKEKEASIRETVPEETGAVSLDGSPRRGRGHLLARGVPRDGQFPGRGRQKTPGFGPEAGKATAQLADRP